MPIGVLNPADVTHSTATRPSAPLGAAAQRRWFSDGLNTEIRDHDFNAILGQIRHVIDHWAIPDVEGDDTLLRQAIQAGAAAITGNLAALQALNGSPAGTSATVKAAPYFTGASTMSTYLISDYSRGLMAGSSLSAWQATLGISAAGKANVIAFGNLVPATNTIGYFTSNTGAMAVTGFTAEARALLNDTSYAGMRTTLGLVGAYSDFASIDLSGAVPIIMNGGQIATSVSPPIVTISSKTGGSYDGYVGLSAAPGGYDSTKGANILCYGVNHTSSGGNLTLRSGTGGDIYFNGVVIGPFATGTNAANLTGVAPASVIPGASITGINASNITSGTLPAARMAAAQTQISSIFQDTVDGADNSYLLISGGGTSSTSRGAYLSLYGNDNATAPGALRLYSGTNGYVVIQSGGATIINDQAFAGTGSGITNLNADNISSGALNPTRIANNSLALAKLADIATDRLVGNVSGGNLSPYSLTVAQVKTLLGYATEGGIANFTIVHGTYFTATDTASGATATQPAYIVRRESPTPAAGDTLGWISFQGHNGALGLVPYSEILCDMVTVPSGNHSGRLLLRGYNAAAATTGVIVGPLGVQVGGGAAGGDKGQGTLNVQVAIYDGGVLITCMPLQPEFLAKGTIDLKQWDALAVNGRPHEAAHHFADLLKQGVDPRDPMKFIAAMKKMRTLPGMPTMESWEHNELSVGEMFNRLWLAVEMFAVAWMSDVEKREAKH